MGASEAELVTTPVAARALGVSSRTLQRYAAAGLVAPALVLPSGQYRWRVVELEAAVRVGAPTA